LDRIQSGDAQRRRLLGSLVTAQEEERRRIASEVHDDSIQVMAAVVMRLGMLRRKVTDSDVDQDLGKLESTVQDGIARLRHLLFQLRPPALDREGLVPALHQYMEQWGDADGLTYEIQASIAAEPPTEIRAVLFRIAQEALNNVRKHARATHVVVDLKDRDGGILLRVSDNGVGFRSEEQTTTTIGHLGLVSMRERAELAGGWWHIQSAPGAGTTSECWIPSEPPGDTGAPA
jgi:signal transduction histidine kinase